MRKVLPAILVLTLGYNWAIAQTDPSSVDRNIKTAVASFNAFETGDMDAAFKDYDKNITYYSNGSATGRSIAVDSFKMGAKTRYAQLKGAFPDGKRQIVSTAGNNDYVMVYFNDAGSWKNDLDFWKATGKNYNTSDVLIYRFNNDGKIIEQRSIMPAFAVMEQIRDGAEFDLNRTGYSLLEQKKFDQAIEVFRLNVKLYPQSGNTYDSLGEAYALAGNKKLAIENYEKSIQLDPKNENGKLALARLKTAK